MQSNLKDVNIKMSFLDESMKKGDNRYMS
jgi:hypothetical protein